VKEVEFFAIGAASPDGNPLDHNCTGNRTYVQYT
jgi:hypothetical protein